MRVTIIRSLIVDDTAKYVRVEDLRRFLEGLPDSSRVEFSEHGRIDVHHTRDYQ